MTNTPVRLRALHNPRFRRSLLVVVAVILVPANLVGTLGRFLTNTIPSDFSVYLTGARLLSQGKDPYLTFFNSNVPDPAYNQGYIYPPFLAWSLQPVTPMPPLFLHLGVWLLLQGCLLAAFWLLLTLVGVRGWEKPLFYWLLVSSWYPVWFDVQGPVNLVLLLLVVLWSRTYVNGDSLLGGAALGASVAIKLLTAPLLVFVLWMGRTKSALGAAVAIILMWVIPVPAFLPEFFLRVAPAVAGGSGFRENQAPLGTISRILHPATFFGQRGASAWDVKAAALVVSLVVVVATARALRRGNESRSAAVQNRRLLEVALAIAALPLILTMQSPSQYVFAVIPMLVVLDRTLARKEFRFAFWAVVLGWTLTGPAHTEFLGTIARGVPINLGMRLWAELPLVGLVLVYLATLRELSPSRLRLERP